MKSQTAPLKDSTRQSSKNDLKNTQQVWRQLEKLEKHSKRESNPNKQFRIVQSVKAGHIRGGHAFH